MFRSRFSFSSVLGNELTTVVAFEGFASFEAAK